MLEIVDDLAAMGVAAVTFSGGGEPFCYPHLAETARRLADGGVQIASLTNGGLLCGAAAEVFAHMGTWIRISLDGWDGPSYAHYRNVCEREFDRVLGNMADFKKLGGHCFLGACYIIDKDNAPHVYDMARRLKDLGVDSIKFSPCIISNDGTENNRYHAPFREQVKEQTARARAELADDTFEVFDTYHRLEEKFAKSYSWCPYLQVVPVIAADQNVYACRDKAYNLEQGLLGSIRDRRFRDFWADGKQKFFRIDPSRHCNHHCVVNYHNTLIHEYLDTDPHHMAFA